MARTYKMRRFQNGKNSRDEPFYNYSLTVPTSLAEQLPKDMTYACELLPEFTLPDDEAVPEQLRGRTLKGILFEPQSERPKPVELPDWARKSEGEQQKPRRARRRPGTKQPA